MQIAIAVDMLTFMDFHRRRRCVVGISRLYLFEEMAAGQGTGLFIPILRRFISGAGRLEGRRRGDDSLQVKNLKVSDVFMLFGRDGCCFCQGFMGFAGCGRSYESNETMVF